MAILHNRFDATAWRGVISPRRGCALQNVPRSANRSNPNPRSCTNVTPRNTEDVRNLHIKKSLKQGLGYMSFPCLWWNHCFNLSTSEENIMDHHGLRVRDSHTMSIHFWNTSGTWQVLRMRTRQAPSKQHGCESAQTALRCIAFQKTSQIQASFLMEFCATSSHLCHNIPCSILQQKFCQVTLPTDNASLSNSKGYCTLVSNWSCLVWELAGQPSGDASWKETSQGYVSKMFPRGFTLQIDTQGRGPASKSYLGKLLRASTLVSQECSWRSWISTLVNPHF